MSEDKEELSKIIRSDLNKISEMSVEELLLYKKWHHLNSESFKEWYNKNKGNVENIKRNIWIPEKPEDFFKLNIKVIPVNGDKELAFKWEVLRNFTSSMLWSPSPGRLLKFIVVHEEEEQDPFGFGIKNKKWKYLGCISVGSDFIAVGGRDKVIGWTREQRLNGMLNHTCMGSSIVPTQPLGYSFLGGKLIALLTGSQVVENTWNSKYKENLAGLTTTSLFGGFSQYNNLKYWKKCESSEGKVKIEPSNDVYEQMRIWLKENIPEKYPYNPKNKCVSHPRHRILNHVTKALNIKLPENKAPRGVYWCDLFSNTREFLRQEDTKLGERKFDNNVESLTDVWKYKYAEKRMNKLLEKDKFSYQTLFYDDIIESSWEEVQEKYLNNVGR